MRLPASMLAALFTFLERDSSKSPVAQPSTQTGESLMTGADIWNALTGPQSANLWQIFAAIAEATGHTTGAQKLLQLGQLAPLVGQSVPVHPQATQPAA